MTRHILSIHAHPDDSEGAAGGTLALLARRGHRITIVNMTAGDCGSSEFPPEAISAIRNREAGAAAALVGAECICAGFGDLAVFSDDASRRRVVELLRRVQPDLVLTSSPEDYHCDHEATSMLVRDACFAAPAPNYRTRAENPAPPVKAIPHLYFVSPAGNIDRSGKVLRPGFVVDVESAMETKRAMLAQHASQCEWVLKQHGMDFVESLEEWTRACGRLAGVAFGEAFWQYKGHPYPETPLLEELLGPEVIARPVG